MSKSIKLKNNTFIDSTGVDYKHTNLETTIDNIKEKDNSQDTSISNINNYVNRTKIVDLYGSIKTPSLVTLSDNVQNYDLILVGMTSNYWAHYQYVNVLGYGLNGLYDWRNQMLAYFSGGYLVQTGYCKIYDNKFDATGLTNLSDNVYVSWVKGVKL